MIKLSIYESHAGLLNNGDVFRVILPPGVKWNNDIIHNIVGGIGSMIDQHTLQIEVQKEQNTRASIEISLLVSIDGFEGELQAHLSPMGSKVTEENITFAYVTGTQSINETITFPK